MSELPPRHAAVIGINKYADDDIADLRSAVPDAQAVTRILREKHGYVDPIELLDEGATLGGIVDLLEKKLPALVVPDSGLVLYFAGHGLAYEDDEKPKGYLIPQNARLHQTTTYLSMDKLRDAVNALECRHLLVVLDCCYAGSFRWASPSRATEKPVFPLYESQYARFLEGPAWQVLTSASHDQLAADLSLNSRDGEESEGHSPFAAAFLAGLEGKADWSSEEFEADAVITAPELYLYVREKLRPKQRAVWQTPGLWPLRPENTGEYIFLSPGREPNVRKDPPLDDANNPWRGLEDTRLPDPGLAQLREVLIETPAESKALFFEPLELVDELLDEVSGMPGAVPLLALTLAELYREARLRRRRTGALDRALTWPDYREVEGVKGTVNRVATTLVEEAGDGLGATVRRVLLRMVSFEGWELSRRRVARRELQYADGQELVKSALDRLVAAHLVVVDPEHLEPAHDALVREWPLMKSWLDEFGKDQLLLRAVWRAATAWDEARRAPGLLWDDDPRRPQVQAMGAELNRLERQFVDASKHLEEDRRRVTVARDLISQDPTRAALVLLEVTHPDDTPYAAATMFQALGQPLIQSVVRSGVQRDIYDTPTSFVCSAAFNAEGTRIITGSTDGTVRVWNVDGRGVGEPMVLAGHEELVYSVAFDASGTRALAASMDGTARMWIVDGPEGRPPGEPTVFSVEGGQVTCAAFSADGTRMVAGLMDGTARVWSVDVAAGHPPGEPLVLQGTTQDRVWSAAFSAGGTKVLTVSGAVEVWNADGSGGPEGPDVEGSNVVGAAINADGTQIVLVKEGGTEAWLWNADGSGDPVVLEGHDEFVWWVAFSADGSRVISASLDETARVWRRRSGSPEVILRGHHGPVTSASFDAGGTRVVTASIDRNTRAGIVRVWNGSEDEPSVVSAFQRPDRAWVISAVFNSAGNKVLTVSLDSFGPDPEERQERSTWSEALGPYGPVPELSSVEPWEFPKSAHVWDVDARVLRGDRAAFSADGTRALTVSPGTVRVWNLDGPDGRTPVEPVVLRIRDEELISAAFSTDGTRVLVAASSRGSTTRWTAEVWNADGSGKPFVRTVQDEASDTTVQGDRIVFSPDGTRVLILSEDGIARVWHTGGSEEPVVLRVAEDEDRLDSAAFSPDGARVLTGSSSTVRVWALDPPDDPNPSVPVIIRDRGSARFSADGTKVLITSSGRARVWKADGTGELFALQSAGDVTFNADGTKVLVASDDGRARVWHTDRQAPGEPVAVVEHGTSIDGVAFSADGTRVLSIASTSTAWTARVWNADGSGAPVVLRRKRNEDRFLSAINADGTRVLLAYAYNGADAVVWLWNTCGTGEAIEIRGHGARLDAVAFSAGGTWFLTSGEGTARVWPLDGTRLQDAIRAATTLRLEPDKRVMYLGESRETAWKNYAEGELGDGNCPRAWGFDPEDPEAAEPFLSQLSEAARKQYEACEERRRDE